MKNKLNYYTINLFFIVLLIGASIFVGDMMTESWNNLGIWSILYWIIGSCFLFVMMIVDAYVKSKFFKRNE